MLDGVSLDQLRAFIAAVDEGSFSAAARRAVKARSARRDLRKPEFGSARSGEACTEILERLLESVKAFPAHEGGESDAALGNEAANN